MAEDRIRSNAYRDTIDLVTQEALINNLKEHEPFRVWLGAKWLATYIAVRPGEMVSLNENQVDRNRGLLIIPHPKEKRAKIIPLVDEDIELIRSLPLAFDQSIPFFRHECNRCGVRDGTRFSVKMLYHAWGRACKRLGVEGVTLYPGTKHSTAMGLRVVATPEEIKSMTLHSTSAAFNRYFQTSGEALKELQGRRKSIACPDNEVITGKAYCGSPQVIDFTNI